MTDTTPEPMTETAAFADLEHWSQDRHTSQRDALRRLFQNGVLTDLDINALAEICLNPAASGKPIEKTHIAVGSPSYSSL
jgi:hypothetical protein